MSILTFYLQRHELSRRPGIALCAAAAGLLLSGCSSEDGKIPADPNVFATPLVVTNASAQCTGLAGKAIAATSIGEPTTGAVVTTVSDSGTAAGARRSTGTAAWCPFSGQIRPARSAGHE